MLLTDAQDDSRTVAQAAAIRFTDIVTLMVEPGAVLHPPGLSIGELRKPAEHQCSVEAALVEPRYRHQGR
jgi:hypothetical protein